jgi:ABC-type nickel/cobalt efflux system permease component RcnA
MNNRRTQLAEALAVSLVSIASLLVGAVVLLVVFVQVMTTANPDLGSVMARFGAGSLLFVCSIVIHHLVKKLNRLAADTEQKQEGSTR